MKFRQQLQLSSNYMGCSPEQLNNSKVLQLSNDMNLGDLTQEDKFFLIQQIENIQQNIRYGNDGPAYIFQDFEEEDNFLDKWVEQIEQVAHHTNQSMDDLLNVGDNTKEGANRSLEIIEDEADEEEKGSSYIQMDGDSLMQSREQISPVLKRY